jgi:hypothetical protein
MKYCLFLFSAFLVIATACNKDKFTTIPQVEIKSISPKTVVNGAILELKGKFTDQEGDVDSALIVYKWYNGTAVVRKDTFRYSFSALKLPTQTREGDLIINFEYNTNNSGFVTLPAVSLRDTTATLGVVIKDKAANRSDYKESEQIRLKKP